MGHPIPAGWPILREALMAICPVIKVVEKNSNETIVINESDYDSSIHKQINEVAPRATIGERDGGRATAKGKESPDVRRAAKKVKR
jgi:hypothetical protein|tara:strand:+ start:7469 stop:7726 length:258 start_codon:yes stop_codon:yes gene_type:complete